MTGMARLRIALLLAGLAAATGLVTLRAKDTLAKGTGVSSPSAACSSCDARHARLRASQLPTPEVTQ